MNESTAGWLMTIAIAFLIVVGWSAVLSGCTPMAERSVCYDYDNHFAIEDRVIREHCLSGKWR